MGLFMAALVIPATRRRHAYVLQHAAGYFRKILDLASRRELSSLIDAYATGGLPITLPLALVRHHLRRFNVEYLAGQTYLNPHPVELMLRNHA